MRVRGSGWPDTMALVADVGAFSVSTDPDYAGLCGRPARFKWACADGDVMWLCAECFDEFERLFGRGSWGSACVAAPEEDGWEEG